MATADAVRERIQAQLPGATVEVVDSRGDGYHFDILVVAEAFRGRSRVQQHQLVHRALQEWLSTGELHAVSLRLQVPPG